jgi:hypothetical protein
MPIPVDTLPMPPGIYGSAADVAPSSLAPLVANFPTADLQLQMTETPPAKAPAQSSAPSGVMPIPVVPVYTDPSRVSVDLPPRVSARCVAEAATDYRLNPMVLLSILKVESNGTTGVVHTNRNGTKDVGPGQFNTASWLPIFEKKFGIAHEALMNDMCQAVRAMGYAVRTEVNKVNGDLWRGIGNYNSANQPYHDQYVQRVHSAYRQMVQTGKF